MYLLFYHMCGIGLVVTQFCILKPLLKADLYCYSMEKS